MWCSLIKTRSLSQTGYYVDKREKELIEQLLKPMDGERLLDVGCGSGNYLRFFRRKGCSVTGSDPSQRMLDIAREKLGQRADLCLGSCEDLPFSDNEFDIVTMIFPDPACDLKNAIHEAIRVCRGRIFLGTANRFYPTAEYASQKAELYSYGRSHSSSIPEMIQLVKSALSNTKIQWGSVIFFPPRWYPALSYVEEKIPAIKNPFGSFIGLVFPVTYGTMTIQDPLGKLSKEKRADRYFEPGTASRRTGE